MPCSEADQLLSWGVLTCKELSARLQGIDAKGYQEELPDIWLSNGNPWEIPRPDITFKIGFYGSVDNFKWSPGETVSSMLLLLTSWWHDKRAHSRLVPPASAAVHELVLS